VENIGIEPRQCRQSDSGACFALKAAIAKAANRGIALFAKARPSLYGTGRFANANADGAVSDFIREVDEDLRRENLEKLWRKYGGYALAAAIVVVLGTAAWVGWQRYKASHRAERAQQFEAAMELVAKPEVAAAGPAATPAPAVVAASQALEAVAKDGDGYSVLARLHDAALKARTGDAAGAIAIYEKLAADTAVDQPFRDLAVILLALQTADTAPPAELMQRLQPLTADSNRWHYSALEITAILAKRAGDTEKAKQILSGLADDLNAPQALRTRAAEMLAALKG